MTALLSACGGNVETGPPGSGTGGATGYGTGGTATGTGGATGGNAGNLARELNGYVDQICDQAFQLPCASSDVLADCYSNGYDLVTHALASGCDAVAQSAFQCGATTGVHCDASGVPSFTADCTSRFSALEACAPSDPPPTTGCIGNATGGPNGTISCSVQCGTLSTSCTVTSTSGAAMCTCDNGRNAGFTFVIASCDTLGTVPDACY